MSAHFYALGAVFGLMTGPAITLASAKPVAGELVLVIAQDSADRSRAIEDAGGRIIGPEQAIWGSLAVSDSPEFIQNLRSSGFWFVVDGRPIARFCGVEI